MLVRNAAARHDIFGSGGAKNKAQQLQVPFLGELPIVTELRVLADRGQIGKAFDNEEARPYLESISILTWSGVWPGDIESNPNCPRLRC